MGAVIMGLWASVQGDPVFMRKVNGWLTIFWLALIPVAGFTGLVEKSSFISYLSLIALVLGNLSAWQASRVECRQEEIEAESSDGLPGEVVEKLIEQTEIKPT